MRFVSQLLIVGFAIAPWASARAAEPMEPGAWQMHMTSTAKDPKSGESKTGPSSDVKICLTKEFLAKDPYMTPTLDKQKMEQKHAKCTTSDHKREGNTASWKITCTMEDGTSVAMTVNNVAEAHKLNSKLEQVIQKDGETMFASMAMDMSFIGQCTDDMPKL